MVSVVIPLYNKEHSIARCIESVIKQTYKDFECIIVDDGSTDNGAKVVKKYDDVRIKYFYKKNGGVSSARNFGVKHSSADRVLFLDADDFLLGNALKILNEGMNTYNVNCVTANFYRGYENKKNLYSPMKNGFVKNPFKHWFFKKFCPRTGCTIFNKKILEQNPFREDLWRYEDAEALFNIMRNNPFYFDQRPVMVYTDDYNGLSSACSDPNKDFLFHMDFSSKNKWEKMCLLHFLNQAYEKYPEKRTLLKSLYGSKKCVLIAEKILSSIYNKYINLQNFVVDIFERF